MVKLFTWSGGKITKGISVQKDKKLGTAICLGEMGHARRYEKVGLFRRNPPEVKSGKVYEAHPLKMTAYHEMGRRRFFYVLEKPENDRDERVLIRVDTRWLYTKNSGGWCETEKGNPETLVTGYGAYGIIGQDGHWDELLVVMNPGDILKVKPEGGHRTKFFAILYKEDGLHTMPFEEYENIKAENGGAESV